MTSAARRLRPEISKNSRTALSSHEGELARSITTRMPAMASLRPSPVMLLRPVLGEVATTSWPPWRRTGAVFVRISPVPPIMTILSTNLLVPRARWRQGHRARDPRVGSGPYASTQGVQSWNHSSGGLTKPFTFGLSTTKFRSLQMGKNEASSSMTMRSICL